jgi:hypothetical protein
MQASLILRCEATATGNLLELLPLPPVKRHLCSDRASVALRPFEFEFNPRIFRFDCILVDNQRFVLAGDNYIDTATIPKSRDSHI